MAPVPIWYHPAPTQKLYPKYYRRALSILNNYRKGTCSLTFLKKKTKPVINSPNFVTFGYWMLEKSYTQYHLQMDSAGRRQVWLHDSINPISRVHVNIDSVSNRDCRLVSGVKYV